MLASCAVAVEGSDPFSRFPLAVGSWLASRLRCR